MSMKTIVIKKCDICEFETEDLIQQLGFKLGGVYVVVQIVTRDSSLDICTACFKAGLKEFLKK